MQSLKAFTIIELIMVVVIVGMMALFAIPNYNKSVAKTYEKTAKNNLLIMFSAQKIKKINGTNYQTCASTAACNTALDLSIIANGIDYTCQTTGGGTPTGYYCYGNRTDNSFKLKTTETTNDPCCCAANTCPTITTICGSCP